MNESKIFMCQKRVLKTYANVCVSKGKITKKNIPHYEKSQTRYAKLIWPMTGGTTLSRKTHNNLNEVSEDDFMLLSK